MIEKIVLNYLDEKLDIPAYMEEESDIPEEYILVMKTGSGGTMYIKNATIAIQSFSTSLYKAAELNEKVKNVMEQIIQLDDVSRCTLNSDYEYTDTNRKKHRYQAVFDIVHY